MAAAPLPPPPPAAHSSPSTDSRPRSAAPLSANTKLALAGIAVVIILSGLGFWGWSLYRNHLGDSQVLAALNAQIDAGRIRFTAVEHTSIANGSQDRTLQFKATGGVAQDLFVRQATDSLLREKFGDDVDRLETLASELATPAGARLLELGALGPPPADPLALVFLEKTAKSGSAITATGKLTATRGPEGWVLDVAAEEILPARPTGKPRDSLPKDVLLLADPTFAQSLDTAVAARLAFAEKLATARVQMAEQLRQEREARQDALMVALQPGALFLGHAEPTAGGDPAPGLVLEIATVKASARQLTALLRNEGNWTDTRPFTGVWETDADFTTLKLPLTTRSNSAIAAGGPLLALRETWTIELSLDTEGHLTGSSPAHNYTFKRVTSGELERTRSALSAAHDAAFAATSPGTAYRGTVAAKIGGEPAPAILRFTRQDNNGAKLEAAIELLAQPGKARVFRGFVAANPHRTGTHPVRLASERRLRLNRADESSVLGLSRDLAPALALDGDTLLGEDDFFRYQFSRANATELDQVTAAGQNARAGIFASVKRGAAYDGIARHRDGFTTPTRLRFTRVDDDGTVEALVESRQQNGVNLRVAGPVDFTERALLLTSTGGKPAGGNSLRVPFFSVSAKYTLRLAVGERTIDGTIEHDADWTLVFNLDREGVAVPEELPPWPTARGVHALIGSHWYALPTNNGRSVNSATARFSKLTSSSTSAAKVAELVFDGKDTVPALPATAAVVLVHIGPVTPPAAQLVEQYPDALRDYPALELAPARKARIGNKRTADLFRVAPEIAGFLSARVAATLSEPEQDVTLFVANAALEPGTYALLANGTAYELQVK